VHANEEVILVLNEKDDDALVKTVFLGCHGMVRVRKHAWLKDGSQVLGGHAILL
jgi:hypothetical protein